MPLCYAVLCCAMQLSALCSIRSRPALIDHNPIVQPAEHHTALQGYVVFPDAEGKSIAAVGCIAFAGACSAQPSRPDAADGVCPGTMGSSNSTLCMDRCLSRFANRIAPMLDVYAICRLFPVAGYSDEQLFGHTSASRHSLFRFPSDMHA